MAIVTLATAALALQPHVLPSRLSVAVRAPPLTMALKERPAPTQKQADDASDTHPDPSEPPLPDAMQGGRHVHPLPLVDSIFVGGGQLAGDWGFDPLGLAPTPQTLAWYREAEMKHARLAMLAALGWPLAEELNGPLSALLGRESLLVDGRAPTLLNGGLGAVPLLYWIGVLALAIWVESNYIDMQIGVARRTDYMPGMLGFDPLKLNSRLMREAEVLNGRVAMVAVVIYAISEAIFKQPVVAETPFLFQPIWTLQGQGWF